MSDKETVCTCGDDAETIQQAALYNPMPLIGDDRRLLRRKRRWDR